MRFLRHLSSLAVAATCLLGARASEAQATITVPTGSPVRVGAKRDGVTTDWISANDCKSDDSLTYNGVSISQGSGGTLEVWAGDGAGTCDLAESRATTANSCWKVYAGPATERNITIRMRDIVGRHVVPPSGPGAGTLADCTPTSFGSKEQRVTLYFLLFLASTTIQADASASVPLDYDIWAPPAPDGVKAGVGEEKVIVSWTSGSTEDVSSYRFYCDPPRSTSSGSTSSPGAAGTVADAAVGDASAGGGGVVGGGAGAAGADGSAGSAATAAAGAGGAGGSVGTSGTSGAAGASGAAGSGGTTTMGTSCLPATSVLVPGAIPPEANHCGSADALASKGNATGLENFREYGVGVAAVDEVGNIGPLSSVKCATPEPVNDFFETYARAGGGGGGGFCAVSARRAAGVPAMLVFAALAALAMGVRRRAKSELRGERASSASDGSHGS